MRMLRWVVAIVISLSLPAATGTNADSLQPAAPEGGGVDYAQSPFVGIKPQRRRVERGEAVVLTVWVSPCVERKGHPVTLLRDGRPNGSRFLSRACTARFLPRVRRPTTFTATVPQDGEYLPAESRHLRIRIEHRRGAP